MKISIITDASCIGNSSGFAFYIGCTAGKIQKAGKLKTETGNISIAEMHCLANALHTLKFCKFKPVTSVHVYMDAIITVDYMNDKSRGFKGDEHKRIQDEIFFLMLDICIANGHPIRSVNKIFYYHHIRAHTGNKDKLSLINNWCDVNARKYAVIKPKKNKQKP